MNETETGEGRQEKVAKRENYCYYYCQLFSGRHTETEKGAWNRDNEIGRMKSYISDLSLSVYRSPFSIFLMPIAER